MNEQIIREIIKEELENFIKSDRFVFDKHLQILDLGNIQIGKSVGTKIATETTQKLGFFNATPVVQPSGSGVNTGFAAGAGTAVDHLATFTGGVGTKGYNISDIIVALKNLGFLAKS